MLCNQPENDWHVPESLIKRLETISTELKKHRNDLFQEAVADLIEKYEKKSKHMKADPVDLVEKVGEKLHQGWMQSKKQVGVKYGAERTRTTHPHLVTWQELDDLEAKNQDRFQASLILNAWKKGKITEKNLPAAIHNSWVVWEEIHGNAHPHALSYEAAHLESPGEHAIQAGLVWPILPVNEGMASEQ